jgi:hypothetical protein
MYISYIFIPVDNDTVIKIKILLQVAYLLLAIIAWLEQPFLSCLQFKVYLILNTSGTSISCVVSGSDYLIISLCFQSAPSDVCMNIFSSSADSFIELSH